MSQITEMQKEYLQQLKDEETKELLENEELIQSFKLICKTKGINLTEEHISYIPTIGIVATYPSIVSQLCPDFTRDKEGLIDFAFLKNRFPSNLSVDGFFYSDKFMLMAHPYFRRGLSPKGNFAPRFVELFWNQNLPDINASISLDYNRVRINVDSSSYMELDTWYGAQFNSNISDIKDGVSKLIPPVHIDEFSRSFLFNDAHSLDIKWETKNGIKTFQAEEFKTEKWKVILMGKEYFPVRYLHAEFDIENNFFRHFDGAVHLYTENEYFQRRNSDFNYNAKNNFKIKSISEKLFKFNGNFPVESWIEFSSQFMTGNPLIIEYFEGKLPKQINDVLVAIAQ